MKRPLLSLATAALSLAVASVAFGQTAAVNDKTILKFSEPVMIPGETLEPGSYIFSLAKSDSNRHLVEIRKADSEELVTITQAVPTKRNEATGDIVVKFNPTEPGTPPAIKAWFYPGSRYGHQFVYPDAQAKQIAQRTKTVVLSGDMEGSDRSRGTLYTYDAVGARATYSENADLNREWDEWRDQSAPDATAKVRSPQRGERTDSTAPAIDAERTAMKVELDELEDNTTQYIGKTVSVDAEVEEIYGPRLFTIDEPRWGDLQGEILVFMPTSLAVLVKDDDRITVTGTVRTFVRADFEREWGWFDVSPELETELALKPVLVADRIVGGNSDVALVIDRRERPGAMAGTAGRAGTTGATGTAGTPAGERPEPSAESAMGADPVTNANELSHAGRNMMGRHVNLADVKVAAQAKDGRGFWILTSEGTRVFVLPAEGVAANAEGPVSIEGVVLQMPSRMRDELMPKGDWNDSLYILATDINR